MKKEKKYRVSRSAVEGLEGRVLFTSDYYPPGPQPLDPQHGLFLTDAPEGPLGTFSALATLPDGGVAAAVQVATNTPGAAEFDPRSLKFTVDGTRSDFGDLVFGRTSKVNDIAVSPDGSQVVFAGMVENGLGTGLAIQRTQPSGSALETINRNIGITNLGLPAGQIAEADSVVVQANGKAVVAGVDNLVSFNGDNSINTAFGDNGIVTLPFALEHTSTELAVQSDGKLLVAGTITTSNGPRMAVARYTADGQLDATFGSGGVATVDFGVESHGRALAVGTDGSVYVGGTGFVLGSVPLLKLTSSGLADPSFANGGALPIPQDLPSGVFSVNSILVTSDGHVVAGGSDHLNGNGPTQAFVLRVTTGGGEEVAATYSVGADPNSITDLAVMGDGRIFAVGNAGTAGSDTLASDSAGFVLKLGANLAAEFESVPLQTTSPLSRVTANLPAAGGEVTVVGTVRTNNFADFALWRYSNSGAVESVFGEQGMTITDFGQSADVAQAAAVMANGKIIVAGSDGADLLIARYLANGQLDTTFGSKGKFKTSLGNQVTVTGVVVDSGGDVLVSGTADGSAFVYRTTAAGNVDTAFGRNGVALPGGSQGLGVAALRDGTIATVVENAGATSQLELLDSKGTLKASPFALGFIAQKVFVRPTGEIVLVGADSAGAVAEEVIVGAGGELVAVPSFGSGGIAHISSVDLQKSTPMFADANLRSDGKIDVALNVNPTAYVVRFNADGTPDTSIGNGGVAQVVSSGGPPLNFPGEPFAVSAVTELSNNKIIIGGEWIHDAFDPDRAFISALDGGITQKVIAPAAGIEPVVTPGVGGKSLSVTVRYESSSPVRAATLGKGELVVTGPSAYKAIGKLVSHSQSGNLATVVYSVAAPKGGWKSQSSGSYTFTVLSGKVTDNNGVGIPGAALTRKLTISSRGTKPDLAVMVASPVAQTWPAGVKQKVTLKIINIGTATARGKVGVLLNLTTDGLSTDPENVPVAGKTTVNVNLKPGASQNVTFTFEPDRVVGAGTYGVNASISPSFSQSSGSYNGNKALNEPTVVAPDIDLVGEVLSQPASLGLGQKGTVQMRVTNTGTDRATGTMNVTVNELDEPQFQSPFSFLGTTSKTIDLKPGQSIVFDLAIQNPNSPTYFLGDRYLGGQVAFSIAGLTWTFNSTETTHFA